MKTKKVMAIILVFILSISFISCDEEDENIVDNGDGETRHFVAIAGLSSLHLIDVDNQQFINSYMGLGLGPNWIIYNNQSMTLYVINSLSNNLQVIQYRDEFELVNTADLGLQQNNNPYAGVLSEDCETMYITNLMQNSISVLDVFSLEIDTTWQTGISPEGIVRVGDFIYVVNTGYDFSAGLNGHDTGSVYKFDASTGEIVDTVQVGFNPQFIEYTPHGETLHVTCTGNYDDISGEIYILDTDLELVQIVPVDAYPGRIHYIDGEFFVACGGWESEGAASGLILNYNYLTPENIQYIDVDNGAIDIDSVTLNPQSIYVACYDDLTICSVMGDSVYSEYEMVEPPVVLKYCHVDL